MKTGTKSLLFGVHQFILHPLQLSYAWTKLYGFPRDFRYWVLFFVHDLGYIGKNKMDDEEGERHVELGAILMSKWFDKFDTLEKRKNSLILDTITGDLFTYEQAITDSRIQYQIFNDLLHSKPHPYRWIGQWGQESLFHSRFYAKKVDRKPSKLCIADKYAIVIDPWWLYIPRALLSGEIHEYIGNRMKPSKYSGEPEFGYTTSVKEFFELEDMPKIAKYIYWHTKMRVYVKHWVENHKKGEDDVWTQK